LPPTANTQQIRQCPLTNCVPTYLPAFADRPFPHRVITLNAPYPFNGTDLLSTMPCPFPQHLFAAFSLGGRPSSRHSTRCLTASKLMAPRRMAP